MIYRYDAEELRIEPWGDNSLRVRATKMAEMPDENWALLERCGIATYGEAARGSDDGINMNAGATNDSGDEEESIVNIEIDGVLDDYGYAPGPARISNAGISAYVSKAGKIAFYNARGELLLEEFTRNRKGFIGEDTIPIRSGNAGDAATRQRSDCASGVAMPEHSAFAGGVASQESGAFAGDVATPEHSSLASYERSAFASALDIEAREFVPIIGGDYALTVRFEANAGEKIYGMGQYQQPFLELKGAELELAQRNSQASVPFMISNKGYGFLWNNPAIGRVTFGKGGAVWHARSTKAMDYWITASDTPAGLLKAYGEVTGYAPEMPEYAKGFWQCKLRYQTQDELLSVAREYKRRGLPISVIVVDYFHWTCQGDWQFDVDYWPDPEGMVKELREMGIELMISIWPTVDVKSENYDEMVKFGYLIRTERGIRIAMNYLGNTAHFDATNPGAREYIWRKAKKNYYDKGIRIFWLDEAEPEYKVYDFDHYRYHLGSDLAIGNIYPTLYSKAFYDGMTAEGQERIMNLVRCAWAGSQRYGALVWSGDIHSSFRSMRNQLVAGLNMGLSGIPWWTTDIGGFHGGNPDDPAFRELFIRWFEYGAFCPVMRLHGYRDPHKPPIGTSGGGLCDSGADNEVWSYGEEALVICEKYLRLRELMRGYISELSSAAHTDAAPMIRPLFFDFPGEAASWDIEDEYMFGPDVLVAPILEAQARSRAVWLPSLRGGEFWTEYDTGERYAGGQLVTVGAPLDTIPVFMRNGRKL